MEDFELPPQHQGQAKTMLICEGPRKVPAEIGYWFSPEVVAELIAAEREACAKWLDTYDGQGKRRAEAIRNGDHHAL